VNFPPPLPQSPSSNGADCKGVSVPLQAHAGPAMYWSECPQGIRKLTSHSSYRVSPNPNGRWSK
jgi:hypothetical protein